MLGASCLCLPNVPRWTDKYGNALGTETLTPQSDVTICLQPLPKENGPSPSDNALSLWFSPPTETLRYKTLASRLPIPTDSISRASPTSTFSYVAPPRSHTQPLVASGLTSLGRNDTSVQETDPCSLDRSQNCIGDASAFPLNNDRQSVIPIGTVLDQAQGLRYAHDVDEIVTTIKALLNQSSSTAAEQQATVHSLRMQAITLFGRTLNPSSGIRLFSEEELLSTLSGHPCSSDPICSRNRQMALAVTTLIVELVKAGISTSGDLVAAAAILHQNRRHQGYLPLLHLLLEAGKNFTYTYGDKKFLMSMKHELQAEKASLAIEIAILIDAVKYARRTRQ